MTATDRHTTAVRAAARRFPLLGRPRPACPTLHNRVAEVVELAAAASHQGPQGMADAAHALNKAALIASDCGLPDLAATWCWQHIACYQHLNTLTALQASYLLEPVLNLARLRIRARHGEPALRLLHDMYRAVTTNTDLNVDNHTLPLANLTGTRDERRKLHEWAWLQYLGEGVRINALNDRWDDAVTHAAAINGIGLHLMDGRQAAILAHCLRGDLRAARDLLEASTLTQPWERQVGACLAVMCSTPGEFDKRVTAMVEQFLTPERTPEHVVYQTRLGLTVATLANDHDTAAAQLVFHDAAQGAIEAQDGYASRDVLRHDAFLHLPEIQRDALARQVANTGLDAGHMPSHVCATLHDAVATTRKHMHSAAGFLGLARPPVRWPRPAPPQ